MELFHRAEVKLPARHFTAVWCVYAHFIRSELFFIGMTKLIDVFQHKDAYLNHHWVNTVNDDTELEIVIMQTSIDKNDSYKYQSTLIRSQRPIANVQGFKISGKNVVTCVQGPNAGTTYGTVTEAAERNGVSQPAMSNHLNCRRGYETLRGMIFKRGPGAI